MHWEGVAVGEHWGTIVIHNIPVQRKNKNITLWAAASKQTQLMQVVSHGCCLPPVSFCYLKTNMSQDGFLAMGKGSSFKSNFTHLQTNATITF